MKRAFEEGVKARAFVEDQRALRKHQSGLDVRYGADPCPICKVGTLHWRIMPNDHCHMHCSAGTCVSWIE